MPRMKNQSHRMKVISKHHRKRRTTARKRSLKSSDDVAGRNNNGRSETIYHHQKFEPSNLTVAAATAFTEMLRYKDLMKMSVRRGCYKYIVLCLSRSFCFFFFFNVLLLLFPTFNLLLSSTSFSHFFLTAHRQSSDQNSTALACDGKIAATKVQKRSDPNSRKLHYHLSLLFSSTFLFHYLALIGG